MIAVVQRVSEASVKIDGKVKGEIGLGFMVLLGVALDDTEEDTEWICKKIIGLRIFSDSDDKLNLDIKQAGGDVLLISQFSLQASTKKGNRPSFINAARPEKAIPLYEKTLDLLTASLGKTVASGEFGADMKVSLVNDGPMTIVLDSKDKK
ncbi:D-aminoacyl-tRNA deacylase [Arcticibacterium luteifluviistationis]|uniref:D-aminoacyl-tRNA deacylase n=1 Tax=Arcticibacterium luteifluviistationis TaxID=1784714 RepID=A0A2Z4G838_9BACT|nr:D-aminoacyl-tRNA deacylase [Arcticibacterium luteifluviistationis]AWV97265.1 D-tyrosyl-tRNA(Tyr) deacylase [Arcticibacterium luteifluviistationis]